MADRTEALARGLGQGFSGGWNDEALGKILAAFPMPAADEGVPRTYAAGSESTDVTNIARAKDEAAKRAYPKNFGAGELLGSAPAAIASSAVPGGAAAYGALAGGGHGGWKGAALGGALGGAGEAAGALAAPAVERGMAMLSKAMPEGQLALPNTEPAYWHHNTPTENIPAIAESGLQPSSGGKNFPFKKNSDKIYLTDPESAPTWGEKLRDATGKEISEIRTTKPVKDVPGANESIKIRTEAIPPTRLEMKTPEGWKQLKAQEQAMEVSKTATNPGRVPQQLPFNFERGNALRPTAAGEDFVMPTIPRPGRTLSEESANDMMNVADAADNLTSAANKRLVERSYAKAANRNAPVDIELERAKQLADRAKETMQTARPPRRASK
jgi:hypothetical protein